MDGWMYVMIKQQLNGLYIIEGAVFDSQSTKHGTAFQSESLDIPSLFVEVFLVLLRLIEEEVDMGGRGVGGGREGERGEGRGGGWEGEGEGGQF